MAIANSIERARNFSPEQKIQHILAAAPGVEAVMCLMMPPELSLYETNAPGEASVIRARQDHLRMQEAFEDHDTVVFNMREIIGRAIVDRAQHRFQTPDLLLAELKRRTELLHKHYGLNSLDQAMQELRELLFSDVRTMGSDAAVSINGVLTNCIGLDGKEVPFDYSQPAAGNFMYWRDPLHITGGKIGTHTMHYSIRDQEVRLAQIGLAALGLEYTPLRFDNLNASSRGGVNKVSIEGGDVLNFDLNGSLYTAIGQSERTAWEAVEAWYHLHEADFSLDGGLTPIMVKGPAVGTQDAMHVDTFSSQVAPGAVMHCGEITRQRPASILYMKHGQLVQQELGSFGDWLDRTASHSFDMSRQDQLNYVPNGVMDGDTFYLTRSGSDEVMKFLKQHVKDLANLEMNDLTRYYGAIHCSTTYLR